MRVLKVAKVHIGLLEDCNKNIFAIFRNLYLHQVGGYACVVSYIIIVYV